jgi:hypothetical protein
MGWTLLCCLLNLVLFTKVAELPADDYAGYELVSGPAAGKETTRKKGGSGSAPAAGRGSGSTTTKRRK